MTLAHHSFVNKRNLYIDTQRIFNTAKLTATNNIRNSQRIRSAINLSINELTKSVHHLLRKKNETETPEIIIIIIIWETKIKKQLFLTSSSLSDKCEDLQYKVIITMVTRPLDDPTSCGRHLKSFGLGYVGVRDSVARPWVPISSPLTHMVYVVPYCSRSYRFVERQKLDLGKNLAVRMFSMCQGLK